MKRVFTSFVFILLITSAFATAGFKRITPRAREIFLTLSPTQKISLLDFSTMKISDYENTTGKHLNFFSRLAFRNLQRQLRHDINKDCTLNQKFGRNNGNTINKNHFNVGWFLFGLLFGPLGVLVSFLLGGNQELKNDRQKWALVGFAGWLIIVGGVAKVLSGGL